MDLNIPTSLIIVIAVIQLLLLVIALFDLIRRDTRRITGHESLGGATKIVWGLIVVLVSTLGPIIYLVVGRKD